MVAGISKTVKVAKSISGVVKLPTYIGWPEGLCNSKAHFKFAAFVTVDRLVMVTFGGVWLRSKSTEKSSIEMSGDDTVFANGQNFNFYLKKGGN